MTIGNSVSDSGLRPQIWSKDLWADTIANLFFMKNGMMGVGNNNVIKVMDDLAKKPGDRIIVPMTTKLSGDGVSGDSELEGQEEKIQPYYDTILIDQMRHAVRLTGKLDEKKNAYNMRSDAKEKLKIWFTEFLEKQFIHKLCGVTNPTLTDITDTIVAANCAWSNTADIVPEADTLDGAGARYLAADYTNGADSLASTDIMSPALISRAKVKAMTANPKIQPLRIDGKNYFIMLMHPWQMFDLKQNAVYAQAQREAGERGKDNPIFTGAAGIWDGVVLYEHEYMPFLDISGGTGGGYNFGHAASGTVYAAVDAFRAVLLGQNAAVFAKCQNELAWVEKDFDYENKTGFASGIIGGIQKITFNSKDNAVISLDTAATAQL